GLFQFDSLGALDLLRPSSYTRQVPLGAPTLASQYVLDAGLFAQTEWRQSSRVTTTFGARWDATSFLTAARENPLVAQVFGLQTNRTPTDWRSIQPRAQVS